MVKYTEQANVTENIGLFRSGSGCRIRGDYLLVVRVTEWYWYHFHCMVKMKIAYMYLRVFCSSPSSYPSINIQCGSVTLMLTTSQSSHF